MMDTCKNGHVRTPDNTYITPGAGWRSCKICRKAGTERFRTGMKRAPRGWCRNGHEYTDETRLNVGKGLDCKLCRQERNRKYRRKNPGRANASNQKWRAANIEVVRAWNKQYYQADPTKSYAKAARRRSGQRGSFSREEWSERKFEFGNRCAYCLQLTVLTLDHVSPLVAGGAHDEGNIVPACLSCNSAKQDKTLLQFLLYRKKRM